MTAHDNTLPFTQHVATLLTYGPVTFSINWVPNNSTHDKTTGLRYVWINRQERTFKIVDPDGLESDTFNAVIESIDREMTVGGVKKGSVTLRPSGTPTFA